VNEEADKASKEDSESNGEASAKAAPPHWGMKALRVFLFTFLGTFLAALLFGDPIPNGLRVDFDVAASIKLGLIAAVIAAVLRALAAMLPLFADD